ncbi:hypothetical protein AgCh_006139 [Apium graveolens]
MPTFRLHLRLYAQAIGNLLSNDEDEYQASYGDLKTTTIAIWFIIRLQKAAFRFREILAQGGHEEVRAIDDK